MARNSLLEDENSRLRIVAEIIMPSRVNLQATELFADRLRDFLLGPRMPGWCDAECFTVKIEKVKEQQCTGHSEIATKRLGASLEDLQTMGLEIH